MGIFEEVGEALNVSANAVKAVGKAFSLRRDEGDVFDEMWKCYKESDKVHDDAAKSGELEAEVTQCIGFAAKVADHKAVDEPGFRQVKRLPATGRYLIVSDLHMGFTESRQNFFGKRNKDLYREVLGEYYSAGYTLIENGDVEELLIFEPTIAEARKRVDLVRRKEGGWKALNEHRRQFRLKQLRKVLQDNQGYYDQIASTFLKSGRYVKIAGNHDTDLLKADFLDELRTALPRLDQVYDLALIEEYSNKLPAKYVILHGHQFDHSCTPRFAPRLGETISESLSWVYQGPDRNWLWPDKIDEWVAGKLPVSNQLVTDNYRLKISGSTIATMTLTGLVGGLVGGLGGMIGGAIAGGVVDTVKKNPTFWETVFHHNVAWEYFESKEPGDAVASEVLTGQEFFKYRHMDEVFITREWDGRFPDSSRRPTLVLGHSHEPRMNPGRRERGGLRQYPYYMNSAAVGRFENIVWGIEIVDGRASLVSWSCPAPKSGKAVRMQYSVASDGSSLRAVA